MTHKLAADSRCTTWSRANGKFKVLFPPWHVTRSLIGNNIWVGMYNETKRCMFYLIVAGVSPCLVHIPLSSVYSRPGTTKYRFYSKRSIPHLTYWNSTQNTPQHAFIQMVTDIEERKRLSLDTSQVAHQAGAYPGFSSMKQLGIFLLPPGWDASPSHGYPQH